MENLTWELLAETQGRLDAEMLKSFLEAHGVHVELFQEAIGHHVYPVTVNGLGRVQIFTAKEQAHEARRWLEEYTSPSAD